MSTSAPSVSAPSQSKFKIMMDPWQRRRPTSLVDPAATTGFAIPHQPWTSPGSSPLLPPPRGDDHPRRSADMRIVPSPPTPPIVVTSAARPHSTRTSTSPVKSQGPKHHRSRTSEVLESVLGIYPSNRPRTSSSRSQVDAFADHIAQRIPSQRITIDSQTQPPRAPPPTPAKSLAQKERARVLSPPPRTPSPTPVGFIAELEGCIPAVVAAEAKDNVPSASPMPTPTVMVNSKPRRKAIKPSKIKTNLPSLKPKSPEGKEIYAHLPLPAIPTPSQSRSPSPALSPVPRPSESSPVIDVELEMGDTDGLVEWFENLRWGEVSSSNPNPETPRTVITLITAPISRSLKTDSNSTFILPLTRTPKTPQSAKSTFSVKDRASILDPSGAVRNGEPFLSPRLANSSSGSNATKFSGLLSPVYSLSPGLASYYGTRSSITSSVGDAFRFDSEMGEELSDVDEEHEEHEIDVGGLNQLNMMRDDVEKLDQQVFDGHVVNKQQVGRHRSCVEQSQQGSHEMDTELSEDEEYEDDGDTSDTSGEFDARLEQEIEMILSGTYGGGSPDDWRDGIYSASCSSPEQEDEWEGDIMVGLDIDMGMQMTGKVEGVGVGMGINGLLGDEGWKERPRTRYIAGRNSMLDSDVIFCLRGVDSM